MSSRDQATPGTDTPCERCGQFVCSCTAGPSFWSRLVDAGLVTTDQMVPKGYIEVRDGDGKLLSRHPFKVGE